MSPPRKRHRKSSPPLDDDSTDYKLALLSSLYPTYTSSTLLDLLLSCNGSVPAVTALLAPNPTRPTRSSTTQSSLIHFISTPTTPRRPKKGTTLNLYNPTHISNLTPTTLHTSFFPTTTANTLLQELLQEAETFPPPAEFSLFSRTVASPHTTCFFLRDGQGGEYSYQGGVLPEKRSFTPTMEEATEIVERWVNDELGRRHRGRGEMRGTWRVNAALVNCYRGGAQSVGWHTDQLTYLGPKAVIASISLGCTREFRVRRIVRVGDAGEEEDIEEGEGKGEGEGAYGIWLPHNSLLIMHPGMQEEWKHSIQPAAVIDLHPISGNVRINITYRCFRESLRPEFTPRCECKEATVLRAAKEGKYFWSCAQEYVVGKSTCGFFEWAVFDEYGEPPWSKDYVGDKVEEGDKGVVEGDKEVEEDKGAVGGDKREVEDKGVVEDKGQVGGYPEEVAEEVQGAEPTEVPEGEPSRKLEESENTATQQSSETEVKSFTTETEDFDSFNIEDSASGEVDEDVADLFREC